MSAILDEQYFEWLYAQICPVKQKNPARSYKNLFWLLFTKEFIWWIPNDDNRVEDGRDLRFEFLEDKQIECDDHNWLHLGCSMLEMLMGLSERLAFETNADPVEWFWELLENLDLRKYNDRVQIPETDVHEILDRVIWRTYDRDGTGGLFPLKHAERDQTQVELWYQLNAYILENT